MNNKERAKKVVANKRDTIIRELISCYKRIDYLEGKEFYEGIISDYKKQREEVLNEKGC